MDIELGAITVRYSLKIQHYGSLIIWKGKWLFLLTINTLNLKLVKENTSSGVTLQKSANNKISRERPNRMLMRNCSQI